jgi:hypothetical protein
MKRDLELFKAILVNIESWPADVHLAQVELEDYDDATIAQHIHLLSDAGFLKIEEASKNIPDFALVERLTNAGHDFLLNARQEGPWKEAIKKGGNLSLQVFSQVLANLVSKGAGL